MPRTGQAEKALVATRSLVHGLHAPRMAAVGVVGERTQATDLPSAIVAVPVARAQPPVVTGVPCRSPHPGHDAHVTHGAAVESREGFLVGRAVVRGPCCLDGVELDDHGAGLLA
jgi:hypothetical protein